MPIEISREDLVTAVTRQQHPSPLHRYFGYPADAEGGGNRERLIVHGQVLRQGVQELAGETHRHVTDTEVGCREARPFRFIDFALAREAQGVGGERFRGEGLRRQRADLPRLPPFTNLVASRGRLFLPLDARTPRGPLGVLPRLAREAVLRQP